MKTGYVKTTIAESNIINGRLTTEEARGRQNYKNTKSKTMRHLLILVLIAVAFTSCSKDNMEFAPEATPEEIEIIAPSETATVTTEVATSTGTTVTAGFGYGFYENLNPVVETRVYVPNTFFIVTTTYDNGSIREVTDFTGVEKFTSKMFDVNQDGDLEDRYRLIETRWNGQLTSRSITLDDGTVVLDISREPFKRVNLGAEFEGVKLFVAGDLENLKINPTKDGNGDYRINPTFLNRAQYTFGATKPGGGTVFPINNNNLSQYILEGAEAYIRVSEANAPEFVAADSDFPNVKIRYVNLFNVEQNSFRPSKISEAIDLLNSASIDGAEDLFRSLTVLIGESGDSYRSFSKTMSLSRYFFSRVIIHELGHAVHYEIAGNTQEITDLYNGATLGDSSSSYFLKNENEFFAEMFTAYVLERNNITKDGISLVNSAYYTSVMEPYFNTLFNN